MHASDGLYCLSFICFLVPYINRKEKKRKRNKVMHPSFVPIYLFSSIECTQSIKSKLLFTFDVHRGISFIN